MSQAVSRRPVTAGTQVRSQGSPCGEMCGGQSGAGTGLSPSISVFRLPVSFQQRSIFINLGPTFYDFSN